MLCNMNRFFNRHHRHELLWKYMNNTSYVLASGLGAFVRTNDVVQTIEVYVQYFAGSTTPEDRIEKNVLTPVFPVYLMYFHQFVVLRWTADCPGCTPLLPVHAWDQCPLPSWKGISGSWWMDHYQRAVYISFYIFTVIGTLWWPFSNWDFQWIPRSSTPYILGVVLCKLFILIHKTWLSFLFYFFLLN